MNKKTRVSLIVVGIIVGLGAIGGGLWYLLGQGLGQGGTAINTFIVAKGVCYADGQQLPGTYSPNECKQQFRWEKWCDQKGICHFYNNDNIPKLGLCARTQARATTYSAMQDASQCAGAADNHFYDKCEYTPGVVPPWKCSSGAGVPPPVPSASFNPNNEKDLGLCAVTNNTNTTYLPTSTSYSKCQSQSGGQFKIDFYPNCKAWPGPLLWNCTI